MKPNIFICGPSGTGKSTSLRNLNPATTVILNTEQKALPFRKGKEFKYNSMIKTLEQFEETLKKCIDHEKIEVIVIESFTSLFELIYRKAKAMYSGFDIWDYVKTKIGDILHQSKNANKYIIFLGTDEVIEGANGVEERCISIDGSWKKKVEKEFVIVLYTRTYEEDNITKYGFVTNRTQGYNNISAKSPMDMLPIFMDNDIYAVIQKIEEYYGSDAPETQNQQKQEITK